MHSTDVTYWFSFFQCQGETLEEVIIDFGSDKKLKLKNFIVAGSFYVGLTRVKKGSNVFLKSFEKSYIVTNKRIEEIMDAMRKFRSYVTKKIYLDEEIFNEQDSEIKIGYLNINGIGSESHSFYLNNDHNLKELDMLVLAETKIQSKMSNEQLKKELNEWNIAGRYDAPDGSNHMGLLLLLRKDDSSHVHINNVTKVVIKRNKVLQCQGIIVRLTNEMIFGFIYCRSTPNNREIENMKEAFEDCSVLMGDFNLSHRIKEDKIKLENLCKRKRFSALSEITRTKSNNQLDYILLSEKLEKSYLTGSFHNFISDHKSIFVRLPLSQTNEFTDAMKERLNFDHESHMKSNTRDETAKIDDSLDESEKTNLSDSEDADFVLPNLEEDATNLADSEDEEDWSNESLNIQPSFNRRFNNEDLATCWLNSCLQLILLCLDYSGQNIVFHSELGKELEYLKSIENGMALDPTNVKNILVTTEDTRIALRLSELSDDDDQEPILKSRLNLLRGQQCARDFFVCLKQNEENWSDVCSLLNFELTSSTTCGYCKNISQSSDDFLFQEVPAPLDGSDLVLLLRNVFCDGTQVEYHCAQCHQHSMSINRVNITDMSQTQFITLLVKRVFEEDNSYEFIHDKFNAQGIVVLR